MSEQPKPKGKGKEIFPLVIADLKEREKKGIETYGEALRADNGRNALQDLYEELLDAALYIKQVMAEKADEKVYFVMPEAFRFGGYVSADLPMPCAGEGPAQEFYGQGKVEINESIAQEAHRLVLGDRGEAYGHPIFDMTRSADLATALLRNKLRVGARLEAEDIGQMMICVKQSRQRNKAKRDNLTDTAGYALTLQMIAEWRAANPGVDPRDVFPAS